LEVAAGERVVGKGLYCADRFCLSEKPYFSDGRDVWLHVLSPDHGFRPVDQLLKDFLDMESSQIVTMHIQSVDQNKAIKSIKHTITELDRSKIEEQKKAVRSGYDMDISATRS